MKTPRTLQLLTIAFVLALLLANGCGGGASPGSGTFEGGTQPHFQALGFVGADTDSEAFAVSADGNVVVGASRSSTGRVAFRWTSPAGMVALPLPDKQPDSEAHSVNADGSIVGGDAILFDVDKAFTWDAANGSVLVPSAPLGVDPTIVAALSGDGLTLFGSAGVTPQQAVRYRAADGLISRGFLFNGVGKGSAATGVSSDGTVATGASFVNGTGNQQGFRWTEAGGMTALPLLSSDVNGTGWNISGDGTVIVGWSCTLTACRSARWDSAGAVATPLGSLPGLPISFAFATSRDGTVIVGYATDSLGNDTAFIWDAANGMRDLRAQLAAAGLATELAGWKLRSANGISADGRVIVGIGTNPQGHDEAYRASIQ